jgi:hypothetical protein
MNVIVCAQDSIAASSSSMLLSPATYAALQTRSSINSSGSSNINCSSGGVGALLLHLNEFPDMMTEEEKRTRLQRYRLL